MTSFITNEKSKIFFAKTIYHNFQSETFSERMYKIQKGVDEARGVLQLRVVTDVLVQHGQGGLGHQVSVRRRRGNKSKKGKPISFLKCTLLVGAGVGGGLTGRD